MSPIKLRYSLPRMNFKYFNICYKIENGEDTSKSRQDINVFTFYDDNEQSYLQPMRIFCFQATKHN